MARGRADERSLSVPGGADRSAPIQPFRRRAYLAGRVVIACVVAFSVVVAACPGIENVPHVTDAQVSVRDETRLVRISAGDASGARLVYDKDTGWVSAKCAEFFPRLAVRAIPADYVETEQGLVRASTRARPPVWR